MVDNMVLQQLLPETDIVFESMNASAEITKEERFLSILERMAGRTDAITPDIMMEFCTHVQNENVSELLFVEQNYTANLFNDAELDVVECSIEVNTNLYIWFQCLNNSLFEFQYLMRRYAEAKAKTDEVYLRRFRNAHCRARVCLDNESNKHQIISLIAKRRNEMKRKLYFATVFVILEYVETFDDDDYIHKILDQMLPKLMSSESLRLLHFADVSSTKNASDVIPGVNFSYR